LTELPTGTVTFLFTDIEGSTRLWEEHPELMKSALARHDEILRDAVEAHDGQVVKTTGDGLHAVFATAPDAAQAALHAQHALSTEDWPMAVPLRVRMGLHTGTAEYRDGDYYGPAVNRGARVSAAAHGGQIVLSHATEELVRDSLPDAAIIDLGEHRLRDLSRPERLFQLSAAAAVEEFPPLRSLDAFPGNLPVQVTSFLGRDRELTLLTKAVDESPLVTLTGVGGVGKTRLAVQLAADLLPRFPDGAWLCELAAANDDDTLVQVVAATLGVRPRPGLELDESIAEFLRSKRLLLVLDNCEHLLDGAGWLAELLLHECPGVRIVATSREGLAIEGEHVVPLRSLSLPAKGATGDNLNSAAVRLFVDRAAAAKGDFAVDAASVDAVAEVCRRLDGVPLAIELAAARMSAMSPRDIAARLDERFRLLTGGRRTAVERHQTLRATVDWSYSMLDDRTRTVFDRLGVFVGGFDAAAAEAVVAGDGIEPWDVVDALVDLVGKSMVIAEEDDDGGTRYQLLETLRHYARERLDEHDDADSWRRRHAEYFASFAEQLVPGIIGPDEFAVRRRIKSELDNARAAVSWALDREDDGDVELAVRIIAALALEGVNNRAAGIPAWAVRALPHADRSTPGRRCAIYGLAAMAAFYTGVRHDEAARLAGEALRDGVPPDCPAMTIPFIALANVEAARGNADQVHRIVAEGLRAFAALDAPWHTAVLASCEAIWDTLTGDLDRARELITPVLPAARRTRNPTAMVVTLYAFGWASWQADPDAALAALDESLALTRAGASEATFGSGLMETARLRMHRGELAAACADLREGTTHCYSVADYPELAGVLHAACPVLVAAEQREDAAVIAGFLNRGPVAAFAMPIGGAEGQEHVDSLARARLELGDECYDAAFTRGAEMSYDEIVETANAACARVMSE